MDALILAAGYGMRMDNLTKDIPKPLLKIKNKTLISYAIDLIKNMSFDKIYINTHYKHNMLERFVSENYPDITISYEETILGTGGGIKNIQTNDTVILNTDNLWDQSFENELEKSIKFFSLHSIFAPKSKTIFIPVLFGHKPARAGLLNSSIIFIHVESKIYNPTTALLLLGSFGFSSI